MVWAVVILMWLVEAAVWFALVPLIVRPFGIRLPILWWHRPESVAPTDRVVGRWQYILLEGVLKYGAGSWFLLSTANYIDYVSSTFTLRRDDDRFFLHRTGGLHAYGRGGRVSKDPTRSPTPGECELDLVSWRTRIWLKQLAEYSVA
jgi:hypothetical protein